jgi:SAM-dependent methyltransferase
MFIPFIAMVKGDYVLARLMLSEKACNIDRAPSWDDLYPQSIFSQVIVLKAHIIDHIRYFLPWKNKRSPDRILKIVRLLKSKHEYNFAQLNKRVLGFVCESNVAPPPSGYISYYEDKHEAFNVNRQLGWKAKQKNIYKLIKKIRPKRVLDIGANTGWFSILAERLGAEVIATDIDESSIDTLYLYSKKNRCKILPLLLSFDDLSKEFYGLDYNDPLYKARNLKTRPLFLPATKRLESDVVLLLALLHHLIIGQDKSLKEIFNILSILTKKVLIVEYVSLKDKVMDAESSFFKNLRHYNVKNYNIDLVIKEGKKHFSQVEIFNSNPGTRKLLVFKK